MVSRKASGLSEEQREQVQEWVSAQLIETQAKLTVSDVDAFDAWLEETKDARRRTLLYLAKPFSDIRQEIQKDRGFAETVAGLYKDVSGVILGLEEMFLLLEEAQRRLGTALAFRGKEALDLLDAEATDWGRGRLGVLEKLVRKREEADSQFIDEMKRRRVDKLDETNPDASHEYDLEKWEEANDDLLVKLDRVSPDILRLIVRCALCNKEWYEIRSLSIAKVMMEAGDTIRDLREASAAQVEGLLRATKRNLEKGRALGVASRKATARKNQDALKRAIAQLFDSDDKPGWVFTNEQITEYLSKFFPYERSTIGQVVKSEAAKHRAARKGRLASKIPER